jgi:spore coat polysaccharide biosynthesis predicted glycosyltransferase SpsG
LTAARTLAIRVDGNGHIGLGHVFRCLHLADGLRAAGIESVFLMLESSRRGRVASFLERGGYRSLAVSGADPWRQDDLRLAEVLKAEEFRVALADLLIPDASDDDLLDNPEYRPAAVPATLALLRRQGLRVASMSDQYDRMALPAEVIFNTCPAQEASWYAGDDATRYRLGTPYYLLPVAFRPFVERPKVFRAEQPKVLLFFGGNDHRGFTEPALAALAPLRDRIRVEAIVGAATPDGGAVAERLAAQGVAAHFGLPDVAPVLADADLALLASGNTLFDAAALGLPAIAFSTRVRQRITAQHFHRIGSAIDGGTADNADWPAIGRLVGDLLFDGPRLQGMAAAGKADVDGRGMERVIDDLLSLY